MAGRPTWPGWPCAGCGWTAPWMRSKRASASGGDRVVGLARSQHGIVHRHPRYDARFDTATTGPEGAATAALGALTW